jgi:hypothetical protein
MKGLFKYPHPQSSLLNSKGLHFGTEVIQRMVKDLIFLRNQGFGKSRLTTKRPIGDGEGRLSDMPREARPARRQHPLPSLHLSGLDGTSNLL